ncbi:MAG: Stp1/IreP family PP2C-type Ser/Thr phosphatase [Acidobacteriaceae bacterium]|nr:Stp1/IreP family PP2C-type Ser/Thr phosphatase [Acidobacteriaceae bacterium]
MPATTVSVQAAGKTDVGSVRTNNEDNFGIDLAHRIFVLCDGMGGEAAGEVASNLAVETILSHFLSPTEAESTTVLYPAYETLPESARELGIAIQLANRAVFSEASRNAAHAGMGTTVVAVLFNNDSFSVAHLGDSRLYRVRAGTVEQLTTDHSLVMEQVRRGLLTPEEARHSQMQNLITRALGARETAEPDLETHEAVPGDMLLLCSDGFSRFVPEEKTINLLARSEDLQQCCDSLVEAAKESGSDDNITCVLVRIGAS